MTVFRTDIQPVGKWIGSATDQKPTPGPQLDGSVLVATEIPVGSVYAEYDPPHRSYMWNGEKWIDQVSESHLLRAIQDSLDALRAAQAQALQELKEAVYEGPPQVAYAEERTFRTPWLSLVGLDGNIYADGDAFGTGQEVGLPVSGYITEVHFQDLSDTGSALELALFDIPLATAPTTNSAFSPVDADLDHCQGSINIAASDLANWGSNRMGTTYVLDKEFWAPTNSLTVYFIARGTPTITTTPKFRLVGRTREIWPS